MKGRNITGHLYGEENTLAKLTTDDVKTIRQIYDGKQWTFATLSKRFGVCKTKIGQIVRRECWKHI